VKRLFFSLWNVTHTPPPFPTPFQVTWRNYGFSLVNWFKQLSTKLTTSADAGWKISNTIYRWHRYFPQGRERSNPHENYPHTRETCWASCHARRLAQQVALVCGRLTIPFSTSYYHCWANNVARCWMTKIFDKVKPDPTLGARACCDRSEDTTRRLWSHEHPASLWWVQYLNPVCDWSKFMRVFSLVNQRSSVNQWKDSHKYWPITNKVQILNSPKWGWMLVWPEPPRRRPSVTRSSGTQGSLIQHQQPMSTITKDNVRYVGLISGFQALVNGLNARLLPECRPSVSRIWR
jgi:hypothetical protein